MNKLNKNSINLGLRILTVLAFAFLLLPINKASAQVASASITGCGEGGCNSSWGSPQNYGYAAPATSGGNCYYNSCNTNVTNYYNNGTQQPAYQQTYQQSSYPNYQQSYQSAYQPAQVSYVPPVQQNIVYAPTPVIPTNVVYTTSINPNPTPTVTRVITRTVTTPSTTSTTTTNPSGTTNGTTNPNGTTNGTGNGNNASDLASNALFGSSGFLPSGLIQWVLFGIFILIIVILARRIFGAKAAYEETPMKYE